MASGDTTFEARARFAITSSSSHLDATIRTTMKHHTPQLIQSLVNSYHNVLCLYDIKRRAKNLLDIDSEDSSSAVMKTQLIEQQLGLLEEGLQRSWTLLDMVRYALGQLASGEYGPSDDAQLVLLQKNIRVLNGNESPVSVGTPMSNALESRSTITQEQAMTASITNYPPVEMNMDALLERIKVLEYELGQVEIYAFEWCEKTLELEIKVESMGQENASLEREVERLRSEIAMLTQEKNRACLEKNRLATLVTENRLQM